MFTGFKIIFFGENLFDQTNFFSPELDLCFFLSRNSDKAVFIDPVKSLPIVIKNSKVEDLKKYFTDKTPPDLNIPDLVKDLKVLRIPPIVILAKIAIKKFLKDYEGEKKIFWVTNPFSFSLIPKSGKRIVIYHQISSPAKLSGDVSFKNAEAKLIREANLVLVSDKSRFRSFLIINKNSKFIPLGFDDAFYSMEKIEKSPPNPSFEKFPHPRITYLGSLLEPDIDYDLIEAMGSKRVDWNIFLVGKGIKSIPPTRMERLKRFNNIISIEDLPITEIPSAIKSSDVIFLPLKASSSNLPLLIKLCYGYLSTGKPVVSFPLSQLSEFESLIPMPTVQPGFLNAIDRYLKGEAKLNIKEIIAITKKYTWQHLLQNIDFEEIS